MSKDPQSRDQVEPSASEANILQKAGLGLAGFVACFLVMLLIQSFVDSVFRMAGSKAGSFGVSFLVAIGAAYWISRQFSNPYIQSGGRIAVAVWVGSIIFAFVWVLAS